MRTDRRDFIKLAVAGTAAASTLGLSTTLTGCGSDGPVAGMKRMRPSDVELVRALSPAVLEGGVAPGDTASLDAIVGAFDQLLEDLSEPVVAGVQQAFGLLSFGLSRGLMTGQWRGWNSASLQDARGALGRLRESDIATLNAIYAAVVRLIASTWYALPQGVATTGYPGPPTKVLDYVPGTPEPKPADAAAARRAGTDAGTEDRAMTKLSTLTLGNTTDPYNHAAERGWDITDASKLDAPRSLEADVVIVGTGAGGGTTAEILSKAGLRVVLLEEGPLKTSSQFDMKELAAYRDLYQEGTGRATKDGGMAILQGRAVGGSTTVNWTSSFRTPPETLKFWAEHMGVRGCSVEEMAPHFEQMETRLLIHKWPMPPNENNAMLQRAAEKLGYSWAVIPRNVGACLNLGYCGMGCPVDAKQSMLVTTIPGALDHHAKLVHHARVERVLIAGDVVQGIEAVALTPNVRGVTGQTITVRAKHTVLAGGAINTPALLLRSKAPDPDSLIGKRTFLHPTTLSMAIHEQTIDPFYGAPQSIYSDHFQWTHGPTGPCGFKLEVPPLHPLFSAAFYSTVGAELTASMRKLPNTQCMIALLRDGFDEASPGGTVEINGDGHPVLDYPVNDHLLEGVRRAWKVMVEMQFATGAKSARPAHKQAKHYTSLKDAHAAIDSFDVVPHKATVGSAHVMGGCPMGTDAKRSVTDCDGKLHHLNNLYVIDGSLFPTSIGANPQLSIYGLSHKLATALAKLARA